MNTLRKLILGNFTIKLLSFTIAIFLWFVTMNVNNPIVDKDIYVPLTFKNETLITDKNFVIVNRDELTGTNIQVKFKGKRNDVESYKRYENPIVAEVDLSSINLSNEAFLGQPLSVPVDVYSRQPNTFSVVNWHPLTVIVKIDVMDTKTIPVYANVTGTPKNSYILEGAPLLSKSSISISGPKSVITTVTKAVVPIDVENADTTVTGQVVPVIINSNNVDVTDAIDTVLEPIDYSQSLAKATTVEIITPSLVGTLPKGYSLIEYSSSASKLDVLADETNPILSFNPIVLDSIDISNISKSSMFKEDITQKLAQQGLKPKNTDESVITTTIIVEKDIVKEFEVPVDLIEFSKVNYNYILTDSYIKLLVSGPSSVLANLTLDDISFYCELPPEYAPKEYNTIVTVDLPSGVALEETPTVGYVVE